MHKKEIPIKPALNYGWETFKKHWQLFVGLALLSMLLSVFQNKLDKLDSAAVLLSLIVTIISLIVSIGILKITLRVYDGETPEIMDVFSSTKYFWRYLGAGLLYGLIVAAGLLLFIVPGIIWALKYSMVMNLIVDKDMKIREAFDKSTQMTEGVKWPLFLFGLACFGVVILGAIALGVGTLVAIPVVWLAGVYVYRHLLK